MMKLNLRNNTNFQHDNLIYGPIGENDLYNILLNSNKTKKVFNVTNQQEYQVNDIDLIQINNDNQTVSYEVKTDTVGIYSNNIAYELISNGNEGCMIKSKADFFYYVFIDDSTKSIKRRFLIHRIKLNKWIMTNFNNINNASFPYLKTKFTTKPSGDNTALLLINIQKLIQDNVANEILI